MQESRLSNYFRELKAVLPHYSFILLSILIVLFAPYPYGKLCIVALCLMGVLYFLIKSKNHFLLQEKILIFIIFYIFLNSSYSSHLDRDYFIVLMLMSPVAVQLVNFLNGVKSKEQITLSVIMAVIGGLLKPIFFLIPVGLIAIAWLIKKKCKPWLTIFAIIAMSLFGILMHSQTYLWVDMSWILESSQRLLNGAGAWARSD